MSYLILDIETSIYESFKRKANVFDSRNRVITIQCLHKGEEPYVNYYEDPEEPLVIGIKESTKLIVGHNIKFDLLYLWEHPELIAFLKRGGKIWDTQYAEYLLGAMDKEVQMNSLDSIVESYGGTLKDDYIKKQWNKGIQTIDIHPQKLIEYGKYDVINTELVFKGQFERAKEEKMITTIMSRTEAILCTTEMEFNGVHIDVEEGNKQQAELQRRIDYIKLSLRKYIPELPQGCKFKWTSNTNVSALIFGGNLKYRKKMPILDEDGNKCYTKKKIKRYGWFSPELSAEVWNWLPYNKEDCEEEPLDIIPILYKSGKKAGQQKTKLVDVQGELKERYEDFLFPLTQITEPHKKWKTETEGVWKVNKDVIEELGLLDIPFLKLYAELGKLNKDIGTYYWTEDVKGNRKGMLTYVNNGIFHQKISHVSTITGRQSGDQQQIPKRDKSTVKKIYTSRFKDGIMGEVDYSQLEVVCQGVFSKDQALIDDLNNGVDFHCKRLSIKLNRPYEEIWDLHHKKHDETIGKMRSEIKQFSFQRAYGAGAIAISATTGIPLDQVKEMIEIEEKMYEGVVEFNENVTKEVKNSRNTTKNKIFIDLHKDKWGKTSGGHWQPQGRGEYKSPTGTKYCFREYGFMGKARFTPTQTKNFPIQGAGGEFMQIIQGLLYRQFRSTDNYGDKALLVNTVHDSVNVDMKPEVVDIVMGDVKRVMESLPELLNKLYPKLNVRVPFPCSAEIGKNLWEMQEWI